MSEIVWPDKYLPGTTDNYVSNEVVVKGVAIMSVWQNLNNPLVWPSYYSNASQVHFYDDAGPSLKLGDRFRFVTFGFLVEGEIVEHVPPQNGLPARIAWHGWVEGDSESRLDVHHAWLIEELSGDRLRVLTQETQIGIPAKALLRTKPNPMLNAHQDWLDGLINHSRI